MDSQFSLLYTKRFLPLFLVQFLGAFNDNLLKAVLVVMIAYGLWDINGWDPAVLVAVASGLFILPFVVFCPLAGNLSDKYDKALLIRRIKLLEIVIAFAAMAALYSGSLYFSFVVLVALGLQSAFFSPCKFSILPQHLSAKELIGGNALVTTGTYLAILAGTIIGAAIALTPYVKLLTSLIILLVAVVGYIAARYVPEAPPPAPELKISYNVFAKAYGVFQNALHQPPGVLIGILGVAWFYFVASAFNSQFPNFTKQTLGADNVVLIMFMVMFSVGVAIGGLLNHKLLKAEAHGAYVPLACIFMGVFGVDIYFAAKAYVPPAGDELLTLSAFMRDIQGLRMLFDTFMQAVACGFFVIPLRAIVQHRANEGVRSRVISSSNMMEAGFILLSSVFATGILAMGASIEGLYLIVSVCTVFVGFSLFRIPSLKASYQS